LCPRSLSVLFSTRNRLQHDGQRHTFVALPVGFQSSSQRGTDCNVTSTTATSSNWRTFSPLLNEEQTATDDKEWIIGPTLAAFSPLLNEEQTATQTPRNTARRNKIAFSPLLNEEQTATCSCRTSSIENTGHFQSSSQRGTDCNSSQITAPHVPHTTFQSSSQRGTDCNDSLECYPAGSKHQPFSPLLNEEQTATRHPAGFDSPGRLLSVLFSTRNRLQLPHTTGSNPSPLHFQSSSQRGTDCNDSMRSCRESSGISFQSSSQRGTDCNAKTATEAALLSGQSFQSSSQRGTDCNGNPARCNGSTKRRFQSSSQRGTDCND